MSVFLPVLATLAVLLSFFTAVLGLVNQRKIKGAAGDVEQIAVNVDGQMTSMFLRIDQLLESMKAQGAKIPAAPSPDAVAVAVKARNGGDSAASPEKRLARP
jgi:hypothetical protein